MSEENVDLGHVQALLDIVLGVVVALPLQDLPPQIIRFAEDPSLTTAAPPALLVAALLFTTLYWVETREFIQQQQKYDAVLADCTGGVWRAVPLPPVTFLLGSLLMIALAAASISVAAPATLRPFVVANALFWTVELVGTMMLRRTYGQFGDLEASVREREPDAYAWVLGHINSTFSVWYGVVNGMFFVAVYFADYVFQWGPLHRSEAAIGVLVLVVFRHLVWRTYVYEWNKRRLLRRACG